MCSASILEPQVTGPGKYIETLGMAFACQSDCSESRSLTHFLGQYEMEWRLMARMTIPHLLCVGFLPTEGRPRTELRLRDDTVVRQERLKEVIESYENVSRPDWKEGERKEKVSSSEQNNHNST